MQLARKIIVGRESEGKMKGKVNIQKRVHGKEGEESTGTAAQGGEHSMECIEESAVAQRRRAPMWRCIEEGAVARGGAPDGVR